MARSDADTYRDTIDAYMAAFNAKDLEALGALLASDATLIDWEVSASGRAEVVEATRRIVTGANLRIRVDATIVDPPQAAADLTVFVNEDLEVQVVDLFEFSSDGLIRSVRAFKGPEKRTTEA
jgi:ketosteroid isomerase-like protein